MPAPPSPVESPPSGASRRTAIPFESLCLGGLVASFVALCVWLNTGKDLWLDELFTWYQVRDKTFAGLREAAATGFNLMPMGHFLLLWLLDQVGLLTPWTARLLSIASITGGLLLLAAIWRRLWGRETAFILTALLLSASLPLLALAVEIRPYALSFFVSIAALKCALDLTEDRVTGRVLTLNALCAFALPFVSYPSGFYSAALLAGYALSCLISHRKPSFRVVASFIAGWIVFLVAACPVLLQQFAQNSAGISHPAPQFAGLFRLYSALVEFPLGIVLVFLAMTILRPRADPGTPRAPDFRPGPPVPILLAGWLLIPLAFFLLAKTGRVTVWGERFFVTTAAAIASLPGPFLAAAFGRRGQLGQPRALATAIAIVTLLSLAGHFYSFHRANRATPVRQFAAQLPAEFRPLPLIVAEMNTYFHLLHYGDRELDVHYYAATVANKQLLGRVSSCLRPVVNEDILRMPRFVALVNADKAWATALRSQFATHNFVVKQIRPVASGFIKEMWHVERAASSP